MSERHTIMGPPRGEPRQEGMAGARIRIPLSGTPSPHWSRCLIDHLTTALTGHAAVGHMRLNELVQGHELVLDGVTAPHASALATALLEAVENTNRCAEAREDDHRPPANMSRQEAAAIASELEQLLAASASTRSRRPPELRRERAGAAVA